MAIFREWEDQNIGMKMEANQAYKIWKNREVSCNNWLIKDSVYMPLPHTSEREKLTRDNTRLLQFSIPKEFCQVVYDEKEYSALESTLRLSCPNFLQFFASPLQADHCKEISFGEPQKISVEPTSSFRSFFYGNYVLKVSLQEKVLYSSQIERAVTISRYLNEQISAADNVQILKESFGCYLKNEKNAFGYIVRQIPDSVLQGKVSLVSLVSYVSADRDGTPSLLSQHLRGLTQKQTENFIQNLLKNIIYAYLEIYWNYGVTLELHQQNLLLELDSDQNLTGKIYCRDLDGARLDLERLPLLKEKLQKQYKENYSYVFEDKKLLSIKEGIRPDLKKSAQWNGLMILGFRLYVLDSSIYLIDHALKEMDIELDANKMAINIVNEEIFARSNVNYELQ